MNDGGLLPAIADGRHSIFSPCQFVFRNPRREGHRHLSTV